MTVLENAAERAAIAAAMGDRATIGTHVVDGRFDAASTEALDVEAVGPVFEATLAALEAAGVTAAGFREATIDQVRTFDGRTLGPFRPVRYQPSDDGAFVTLGLQQL